MFSFLKSGGKSHGSRLAADVHSHLLPGLDDGVKTPEEAEIIIRRFMDAGFKKIITTPHIMSDYYRNNAEIISSGLNLLKEYLKAKGIELDMEAAAEYYLDEALIHDVKASRPLLTFGNKYLLFETNYITEPIQLAEFIFDVTVQGYKVVLAHPERYIYMTLKKAEELRSRGVLFQVNTLSLLGYYSKSSRELAREFVSRSWIDFLGSDCHNMQQMSVLETMYQDKFVKKCLDLPLLNHTI